MGLEQTQDAHKIDSFVTTLLDTNKSLEDRIANLEANEGISETPNIYPQRASMFRSESLMLVGAKTLIVNNAQYHCGYSRTSGDGITWTNSFILEAGTYSFSVFGVKDSDNGIVDWYIDDVLIATHDYYAGGTSFNQITTTSNVVISTSGRHVLKGITNGKNASSSAFVTLITFMYLLPATDTTSVESL